MLSINLHEVTVPLPPVVRRLHGASADPVHTNGNGACAIHSVWGDWVRGELFKRDARVFVRDAFGPTPQSFKSRLASGELLGEMELALWDLIAPIAKQGGVFDGLLGAGEREGELIWECMEECCFDVALRCVAASQAEEENFRRYRERKDRIVEEFGSLCLPQFQDVFVGRLMASLGVLEKYQTEDSWEYSGGHALKKFDALFAGTAGARELQRDVVEQACLENSFDLLFEKISDVVVGLDFNGHIDFAPIQAFAESVENARGCNYQSDRLPFDNFFDDV